MNNGQKLEQDLIPFLEALGLRFAGNYADCPDFIGSDGVGLEVKGPGGTFGQVQTPWNGTQYTLPTSKKAKSPARIRRLVSSSGILKRASAEHGTGLTQIKMEMPPKTVREYYRDKGCSYIYFGHPDFMSGKRAKGIFRLGTCDPWNLECPRFNPKYTGFRFRFGAPKGGDRKRVSLVELNCTGISKSSVDLLDI
jgi:hypothetical protein